MPPPASPRRHPDRDIPGRPARERPLTVTGVDGCAVGWVAVTLGSSVAAGAAENDLLEAAAVAWSARRIAAGTAVTLSSGDQTADDGTEIAIRF